MKLTENKGSSDYSQSLDYLSFLIKAYTDCMRHALDVVFNETESIQVLCLASESVEIIIQSQA